NILDGMPVEVIVTGQFHAWKTQAPKVDNKFKKMLPLGAKPVNPVNRMARFDRPVPIGISAGHPDVTAGTIGCRVTDGDNVYALSCNHVFANYNQALIGDPILQPGAFDGGTVLNDIVGQLADFVPVVFKSDASNTIDAAIALTTTSLVGNATPED